MNESFEYRSLGHCKFYNEEIFGTHHNKIQAHQRFCKCNPNRSKSLIQISNASKNATRKEVRNKASKTKKINSEKTYKIYTLKCKNPKCQKEFTKKLKIKQFESGYRIPQYCCCSCANSHVHTDEIKKKIGKSVAKEHQYICSECGKTFMHQGTAIHTTYCDKCFLKINGYAREYFKSHNKKIKKNDTELHSSTCNGCGKIIWSKTSDIVYCYDCCEHLNKHVHQLYDLYGHRIVSDKTRQKLKQRAQERIANGTHIGWKIRPIESYPEKFWKQVLSNNGIEFEFNFYIQKKELGLDNLAGYFLDFKLKNKIDLEIDGKQHKYEDRIQSDKIRDDALIKHGWKVYRIEWNEINSENGKQLMKDKINKFISWYNINVL